MSKNAPKSTKMCLVSITNHELRLDDDSIAKIGTEMVSRASNTKVFIVLNTIRVVIRFEGPLKLSFSNSSITRTRFGTPYWQFLQLLRKGRKGGAFEVNR